MNKPHFNLVDLERGEDHALATVRKCIESTNTGPLKDESSAFRMMHATVDALVSLHAETAARIAYLEDCINQQRVEAKRYGGAR